jgi:hypothetical protein
MAPIDLLKLGFQVAAFCIHDPVTITSEVQFRASELKPSATKRHPKKQQHSQERRDNN